MSIAVIGEQHAKMVDWLSDAWWQPGVSPVCIVQGFPGSGKTHISEALEQRLRNAAKSVAVARYQCPHDITDSLENVVLGLAAALADQDNPRLATHPSAAELERLLREPVLVIIDDFQESFDTAAGQPGEALANWLMGISAKMSLKGRVLLLASRQVEHARWNERCVSRDLRGMEEADGLRFLEHQMAMYSVPDYKVTQAQRADVVSWLGGFPRALKLFTSLLRNLEFEDVIGAMPESWETRNQPINEHLLKGIESGMIAQARQGLPETADQFFRRLAVYRQPVDEAGIGAVSEGLSKAQIAVLRDDLLGRYLLERRLNMYTLHPVLRAAVLHATKASLRAKAHSLAGRNYARHFRAKQLVGSPTRLGREFIELRYHYTQAGQPELIKPFVKPFAAFVHSQMGWAKPLPKRPEERDEQIAVLSALVESVEDKGLHFHLARLLEERGTDKDLNRALSQAMQACGPDSPHTAWLLRLRLQQRLHGVKAADKDLRGGALKHLPQERALSIMYEQGADMLAAAGFLPAAAALLRDGIERILPEYGLFQLYMALGSLLVRQGNSRGALALMKQGMLRIGSDHNGYMLAERAIIVAIHEPNLVPLHALRAFLEEQSGFAPQVDLARMHELVLKHELEQVTASQVFRQRATSMVSLSALLAFCHLCMGQFADAKAALDRYVQARGRPINLAPRFGLTWLVSWIHFELGDQERADDILAVYLGRPLLAGEQADRPTLLGLWDTPDVDWEDRPPCRDFPVLPPLLTGRIDYLHRRPSDPPVLTPMAAASAAPLLASPAVSVAAPVGHVWNPENIIHSSKPDGLRGVYLLGPFDTRITFYTQQVRALSLVRALFDTGDLQAGQSVAVIGGGAAGITAAVAAARAGCNVTLYDERDAILGMQAAAQHRFLHPHIYDWPASGSLTPTAGLPFLNWDAADAQSVVDALRGDFAQEMAALGGKLKHVPRAEIQELRQTGSDQRVEVLGDNHGICQRFRTVIVAVGFGLERPAFPLVGTPSYWSGDALDGPFPDRPKVRILVSGSGDGGLVDVARAAMRSHPDGNIFRHHEAVAFLTTDSLFADLAARVADIDAQARRAVILGDDINLFQRYNELTVPDALLHRLNQLARCNVEVTFNFVEPGIFTLNASLLNRLLVFLLMRAEIVHRRAGAITAIQQSTHQPGRKLVEFKGLAGNTDEFDHVVLRHGPEKHHILRRFPELAAGSLGLSSKLPSIALSQHLAPDTIDWYRNLS